MRKEDFNFDLPEELIAQDPLEDRSSSRLLVLDKETGEALVLSNRQKPYITVLPDIDCYDSNEYTIPELIEYNRKISYIDFEKEMLKINEVRRRFMSAIIEKSE